MSRPPPTGRADDQRPPSVVILGGGYGGVYAALELQKAARRGEIELSLVSRNNFFLFQPMLAEVVSGSIEPPHIVNPIRRLLPHTHFRQADVESVDSDSRSVSIRYPGRHIHFDSIQYDHLVIAVGVDTDLSGLPGMAEHAFPFRTLGDAFSLRNHLIAVIERAEVENHPEEKAELLAFVVAGGGYTGVEVAAEINSFVTEAVSSYPTVNPDDVKVYLLQGADRILPELSQEQAAFSQQLMERRGIEVRLNTKLRGATARSAVLGDGGEIPARTVVAAVGSSPNPLLDTVPGNRDSRGRVEVDKTLAIPGQVGIWAVGDCAAIPDVLGGGTAPPTAQYARREGRHVARNIMASVRGRPVTAFSYRNLGVFVPLGRFSAAVDLMGLKVSGFLAWWLYRTYYLLQLPRLERKLRVVSDWTLELVFRRDIVGLDFARSKGVSRAHYDAGEVVFREGGLARNFYIVLEGSIEIFVRRDGQEVEVATLGAGDFFGERSLLRGVRHSAFARASTPVDLLIMNGDDFAALATASTRFEELLDNVMRQRSTGGDNLDP